MAYEEARWLGLFVLFQLRPLLGGEMIIRNRDCGRFLGLQCYICHAVSLYLENAEQDARSICLLSSVYKTQREASS